MHAWRFGACAVGKEVLFNTILFLFFGRPNMLGFPVEFPLNSLKRGAPEKQGTPPFGCSLILRQTHVYIANGKFCIGVLRRKQTFWDDKRAIPTTFRASGAFHSQLLFFCWCSAGNAPYKEPLALSFKVIFRFIPHTLDHSLLSTSKIIAGPPCSNCGFRNNHFYE